eukprot:scaffold58370_cov21-Cyclotella_meneghiniana.AAC.2
MAEKLVGQEAQGYESSHPFLPSASAHITSLKVRPAQNPKSRLFHHYKGGTRCPGRLMVKRYNDRKMTANTARTCKVCDNARIILHCMKKLHENDTTILKIDR